MATTVGNYLKNTREERGISIDQVSIATRVKIEYLQALELDEPYNLPSRVQSRGFLRLYADYLHLPVEPLLQAWPDKTVELPEEPAPQATDAEGESVAVAVTEPEPEPEEPPAPVEAPSPDEPVVFEEEGEEVPPPQAVYNTESEKIFAEIGQVLSRQREILSITIDDVERFTRLRGRYLIALEEGRLEDLPSLVQGRGMLSNYAEFLNLDSEALLNRFADALQARRIERLAPPPKNASKSRPAKKAVAQPAWRRFITTDLLLSIFLFGFVISFVILAFVWINNNKGKDQVVAEASPPSISQILLSPEATETPLIDLSATVETTETQVAGPTELPAINLEDPNAAAGTATAEVNDAATQVVQDNLPVQLTIIATQRVYLMVTVDGKVAFNARTVPGNAYPFSASSTIELVTGNGAGLQVVYNQTNLGILGSMGEVVRLIFTPEGTEIPTPMFTNTPTQTLQPTATRKPTATNTATPTPTPTIVTPTPTVTRLAP